MLVVEPICSSSTERKNTRHAQHGDVVFAAEFTWNELGCRRALFFEWLRKCKMASSRFFHQHLVFLTSKHGPLPREGEAGLGALLFNHAALAYKGNFHFLSP